MLVLTRKAAEAIQLGSDVTITVLEIKGNKVRLGITAPDHVNIARAELEPESKGVSRGRETARRIRK